MGYRVSITFDLPSRREGQEFQIVGLGVFANGSTHVFTEDQMNAFEAVQGMPFDEAYPTCTIERIDDEAPVVKVDVDGDNDNTEGGN